MSAPFVWLASQSPRRRELLAQIGVHWRLVAATVDETALAGESAFDYVARLARAKAEAGRASLDGTGAPVLGADTAVVIDGAILGKPVDGADALAMLARLSGRVHEVYSAVALATAVGTDCRVSVSRVWFRELTAAQRRAYVASGEAAGKAGAYAIQGRAAAFVHRLEGSYSGVMGLPLCETAELLSAAGLSVPAGD